MIGITWLGHGTFELTLESGEVYVLDPWTDGNPAPALEAGPPRRVTVFGPCAAGDSTW